MTEKPCAGVTMDPRLRLRGDFDPQQFALTTTSSVDSSSRPLSKSPVSNVAISSRPNAVDFAKRAVAHRATPVATSSLDNHRSGSEGSNPQQWFDKVNNNPRASGAFHADHGAPFRIEDSLHTGSTAPLSLPNDAYANPMMLPFRGGQPHMPLHDDNVEEYRSVIDDLTIRNKALKAKLKRYEKQEHLLDSEKLIEVKTHGLPATKKRELENALKKLVQSLDQPTSTPHDNTSRSEATNLAALSTIAKPGSSHTSTKFADSGYGSMTTSNHGIAQRGLQKPLHSSSLIHNGAEASKARNRNIQSYLLDIPEGLLPRQSPAVMTEDTKKRLVVSRLEHLLVGRGAAVGGHQQPIQQQEVSQSAARDDRSAIEALGQRAEAEGKREAAIMSSDVEDLLLSVPTKDENVPSPVGGEAAGQTNLEKTSDQASKDQRPTRPLDLDPHRAQDPRENIKYLRHLGFKLSDNDGNDEGIKFQSDNDWLYLNLVMNLAQLHTLNVTPALVQAAIKDYSSRFELSPDGRKIRWRTEPLPSKLKGDLTFDPFTLSTNVSNSIASGHSRKRTRPTGLEASSSLESSEQSSTKRSAIFGSGGKTSSGAPCVPRVVTGEMGDDVEMLDLDSLPSRTIPEDPTTQQSSGWASSGNIVPQSQALPHDDGPMIYYRKQTFFTDMAGDRGKSTHLPRSSYRLRSMKPLGVKVPTLSRESSTNDSSAASLQAAASHASLDVNADDNSNHDCLSIHSDARLVSSMNPSGPYPFEASGVGCVYPADNFALYVTRQLELEHGPPTKRRKISRFSARVTEALPQPTTSVSENITSVKGELLDPSPLPPPTYAVSVVGSDSGTTDDDNDESSYEYTEESELLDDVDTESVILLALQSEEPSKEGFDDEYEADDTHAAGGDDVSSMASEISSQPAKCTSQPPLRAAYGITSAPASRPGRSMLRNVQTAHSRSPSVDLLAPAREADPTGIREREREYDAELAERLAEEMPAGSSAATHGGKPGSGNNTPVLDSAMDLDAYGGNDEDGDEEPDEDDASVSS